MKRWAIGSIAFLLTLAMGFGFAELFGPPKATLGDPDENGNPQIVVNEPIETLEVEEIKLGLEIIDEINARESPAVRHKVRLLTTGEGFHGDEVEAKNDERWLGLFDDGGQYQLREVPLKITRVFDNIVDDPKSKIKTGKSVATGGSGRSILLLKNAEFAKGKVPTLFVGRTWDDIFKPEYENELPEDILTLLKENFSRTFQLGRETYHLRVVRAQNHAKEEILAIVLESENVRQVLHTMNVDFNSDVGTLYWVGDIDRDGKPDFYVDLFEHYNVRNRVLFISSEAEKGKLLKKVAYFWTTGC